MNYEVLGHCFVEGVTYGPNSDYTDLKCNKCGFEATLDNFNKEIKNYEQSLTDEEIMELDCMRVRISCNEFIIKKLVE